MLNQGVNKQPCISDDKTKPSSCIDARVDRKAVGFLHSPDVVAGK